MPSKVKIKKAAVLGGILFYFCAAFIWSWPYEFPAHGWIGKRQSYISLMSFAGLWQNWGMFSGPRKYNLRHEVEVELADGAIRLWKPPVMKELAWGPRQWRERYRKWSVDNGQKFPEVVWKFAIPGILKRMGLSPSNPAVYVEVVSYLEPVGEEAGKTSIEDTALLELDLK